MKTTYFLSIIFIALTWFFPQPVNARNLVVSPNAALQQSQRRTPGEMAQRETDWMKSELALTDAQLPKIDSLNLKYALKMHDIWEQSQGDRDAMRSKREELNTQKRAELATILTADQLKKYDDAIAARREQMQNRHNN